MTKINDLPDLPANNFDPTQDLIIIQKPNGATYKMLAATALSSIAQGEVYADTKTVNTTGYSTNYPSIVFNVNNLLTLNSSILIKITSSGHNGVFSLTKTAGIANFNNYGIPSTTNDVVLLSGTTSSGRSSTQQTRALATIKIYDDVVEISNIRAQRYSSGKGFSGWANDGNSYSISATIDANIRP